MKNGSKRELVLIVEDEAEIAALLANKIREIGPYDVVLAGNGQEALSVLEHYQGIISNQIKCVFLDIQMPIMNGLQFLKEWRKRESWFNQIPIVMLTAYEDVEKWEAVLEGAIAYYLYKPFKKEGVEVIVKELLGQHRVGEYKRMTRLWGQHQIEKFQQLEAAKSEDEDIHRQVDHFLETYAKLDELEPKPENGS